MDTAHTQEVAMEHEDRWGDASRLASDHQELRQRPGHIPLTASGGASSADPWTWTSGLQERTCSRDQQQSPGTRATLGSQSRGKALLHIPPTRHHLQGKSVENSPSMLGTTCLQTPPVQHSPLNFSPLEHVIGNIFHMTLSHKA